MQALDVLNSLECSPTTGEVFILKNNQRVRKLIPDEENTVSVTINKSKIKMKYDKLVWCSYYKEVPPDDHVVFHKDLDEKNNKINNLCLLPKKINAKIMEAMKNLSGALRLIPHPTDAFSYVLEYRQDSRVKKEVIQDITVAKRKLLKMQLRYIKFISAYVLTS